MPNRLEMVVRGQRQTALPNTPDFTSRTLPADGFFMEGIPQFLIEVRIFRTAHL